MKRVILLCACLWLFPVVSAASGHIHVLTVSEGGRGEGGVADVYLEVRPGSGRLFLDSFPLTRLDTQISTRFAREYACELADQDCSQLDFFYVIRAPSTIVAGPSAGAAMTVLTYATLEDLDVRDDVVITGTINSGGLVGPVGGTEEKIPAARAAGFSTILISEQQYNETMYRAEFDVVPVVDVEEAIWQFTGVDPRPAAHNISVPPEYTRQMEAVMDALCTRAEQLTTLTEVSNVTAGFLESAARSSAEGKFYSGASYCFSANLDLRRSLLRNKSQSELRRVYRQLERDIESLDQDMPREHSTIADLEVFMIVRERLVESQDTLEDLDYDNISSDALAYALERYTSALTWSSFLGAIPSEELDLSEDQLRRSCYTKLGEAEERLNYLSYVVDTPLVDTRHELDNAYIDERLGEWALCTFKASKAKAEADSVLSALYGGRDFNRTVDRKLSKAAEVLGRQTARGAFPTLAYSYYEYALDLEDAYSANLYAEYALELGALDIYFSDPPGRRYYDLTKLWLLLSGAVLGFVGGVLFVEWRLLRKKSRRRRRK